MYIINFRNVRRRSSVKTEEKFKSEVATKEKQIKMFRFVYYDFFSAWKNMR